MRRRHAIQSLLGLPVLTSLPAFPQQPTELKPAPVEDFPKLALTSPDEEGASVTGFFNPVEFATLRRLCSLILPAVGGKPGSIDAGVPEFLDFLIGQSPATRQNVYRSGLDLLEKGARRQSAKAFAELSDSEATSQLTPLRDPSAAKDTTYLFLQAAKEDILRATLNSREWAAASTQRRASATGTYWRTIE